jgi:pimeloyl-ACP methyl ester carboxylesterase
MQEPEHRFYNDLPDDEQKEWASLLKPMPRDALIAPVTHMGYLHHPVTYIHCEIDEAVPKGLQQMMVEGVKAATNISIETKSMPTGHSPFLSNPELVLELYQEYADATVQ